MSMDTDDIENAQMSPNDMLIYKSCPVWEEFIVVKCQYCNSILLPHSIKNHVEVRHTGTQQYEKDPESSIFCKVVKEEKKPSLPTILSSTLNPRASTTAYRIQGSRTSCSADMSPRLAEQCRGWPNSPHGAYQQSPLNMATNLVRVKNENSKMKVVIPPGCSGKMGSDVSMLELSASIPVMKPEPYNQSFSFSSTPNMPSTSALASSRGMPSTSKGLLPCQPLASSETGFDGCMIYNTDLQSSSTHATGSLQHPQPKTPKLVLRRVLQTNPKAPAEGSQSHQDWKGITKNPKDSQGNVFMVVNKKDRKRHYNKKELQLRTKRKIQREKFRNSEMKRLKDERNKLICQLFQELQSVKKKLDQCNVSKKEIEKELLVVKADLEKAKQTTDFQNEVLLKKNAEFENEIQTLKQRNEELTNSLKEQFYTQRSDWDYADVNVSMQFQTIEIQKVELQKRIDKLEFESEELKHSSAIEKRCFDNKLKEFFKVITDLKKRYDEQMAKSQELQQQRDFYEQYLSPRIYSAWKGQVAALKEQQPDVYEVYPGLLSLPPTPPIASPTIPHAETPPADTQNVNYISFQSQLSPVSPEVFQPQQEPPQQDMIQDEEVS